MLNWQTGFTYPLRSIPARALPPPAETAPPSLVLGALGRRYRNRPGAMAGERRALGYRKDDPGRSQSEHYWRSHGRDKFGKPRRRCRDCGRVEIV
jgi:hypothetical protein